MRIGILLFFLLGLFSSVQAKCKPNPELNRWVDQYRDARNDVADILVKMKAMSNPSSKEISQMTKALGEAKKEMSKHRNNLKLAYGKGSCGDFLKEVFKNYPEP
jgi:hypothetical protein